MGTTGLGPVMKRKRVGGGDNAMVVCLYCSTCSRKRRIVLLTVIAPAVLWNSASANKKMRKRERERERQVYSRHQKRLRVSK